MAKLNGSGKYRIGRPVGGGDAPIPVLTGLDVLSSVDVTNAVTATQNQSNQNTPLICYKMRTTESV